MMSRLPSGTLRTLPYDLYMLRDWISDLSFGRGSTNDNETFMLTPDVDQAYMMLLKKNTLIWIVYMTFWMKSLLYKIIFGWLFIKMNISWNGMRQGS